MHASKHRAMIFLGMKCCFQTLCKLRSLYVVHAIAHLLPHLVCHMFTKPLHVHKSPNICFQSMVLICVVMHFFVILRKYGQKEVCALRELFMLSCCGHETQGYGVIFGLFGVYNDVVMCFIEQNTKETMPNYSKNLTLLQEIQ